MSSKLTENTERSEKQENVIGGLFSVMRKVATELDHNRGTALQTNSEIAPPNQKLEVVNGNIIGEVQ